MLPVDSAITKRIASAFIVSVTRELRAEVVVYAMYCAPEAEE